MRTALVTGCLGQDGRYLTRLLLQQEYRVIGVARTASDQYEGELVRLDVTDYEGLAALTRALKPDEIYHLAALHHSAESDMSSGLNIEDHLRTNTAPLSCLLATVAEYLPKARLFYAASSRVFGKPSSDLQDEATPINPICAYGISKAAGIFLCRAYRRSKSIFAAAGILYNHESPLRPVHFVTRKITRSAARAKLGLRGTLFLNDLHASVDWGAATDFADAMQRIILLNEPDDFIVATGKTSLVREFANAAFSHVGLDPRDFISDFDTHVSPLARRCLCGDYSKLRNSTGWQPRLGLTEIVAEMVDFDLWQLGRETADLMVNASHVLDA